MNTASLVLGWVMTAMLAVVMPFVAHERHLPHPSDDDSSD